jgi:hypothetical protein
MKLSKEIEFGTLNGMSPQELYKQLRSKEEKMSEAAFRLLEREFANARFFGWPLFGPFPGATGETGELITNPGTRYKLLLLKLGKCQRNVERLFILATWLRLEGICEPEDLLGKDFSQYRRKALRGERGRLSITDLRQALIVDNWLPYFEWLLRARKQELDLRRLGFDESAIRSAERKRSALAAACEDVCGRFGVDAPALANAYSRTLGRAKKLNPKLSKR